jgi:hydrogenase maturation protease
VEFLDGGTQGLALLGRIAHRYAVVMLDAVRRGAPPGTVHLLSSSKALPFDVPRATTAHEGNAGELLSAAELLGESPQHVVIVGVEPENLTTGMKLSKSVAEAVPEAVAQARSAVHEMVCRLNDAANEVR